MPTSCVLRLALVLVWWQCPLRSQSGVVDSIRGKYLATGKLVKGSFTFQSFFLDSHYNPATAVGRKRQVIRWLLLFSWARPLSAVIRQCTNEYRSFLTVFMQLSGKLRRSPRKCPHCSKQFVDNYCLRRHMISHTGKFASQLHFSFLIFELGPAKVCMTFYLEFTAQVRRGTNAPHAERSLLTRFTWTTTTRFISE